MNRCERGITLIELLIAISLLSLLSVGMMFAMRIGLNSLGKLNTYFTNSRRVLSVDRIITEQIAGFVPAVGYCGTNQNSGTLPFAFFQGDTQTMRFISTYSVQQAGRGTPRVLEFQVVPGENGQGVRLLVNETPYTGPLVTANFCAGTGSDPATGKFGVIWKPFLVSSQSFVLADKLARCQFLYKEDRPSTEPRDVWHSKWTETSVPAAVRIDWAPQQLDPSRLQLAPLTAAFRVTRSPFTQYTDY